MTNTGNTVFVAATYNLQIAGRSSVEVDFGALKLSSDWRVLKRLVSPEFFDFIGMLEERALLQAPAFVYSLIPDTIGEERHKEVLDDCLYRARMISMGLWFLKDNAVDYEAGFLVTPRAEGLLVTSNFVASRFTMKDGSVADVTFSPNELRNAAKFLGNNFVHPPTAHPGVPADSTRIERAFYFLQVARDAYEAPLKVAYYCTAFECLFATSTTELTHKLGERVAALLSEKAAERLALYKRIKQAYQVRSKVVHGDRIKDKDQRGAIEAAAFCDDAIRGIFTDLLSSERLKQLYRGKPDVLEDFLMLLTFGANRDEALALED